MPRSAWSPAVRSAKAPLGPVAKGGAQGENLSLSELRSLGDAQPYHYADLARGFGQEWICDQQGPIRLKDDVPSVICVGAQMLASAELDPIPPWALWCIESNSEPLLGWDHGRRRSS